MFSALSQGGTVYILDKSSSPKYQVGEVIGVSLPKFNFGLTTVDLKIKIGDIVQDFNNILGINSITSYNNGKIIISETKQGILNEVEGILQNSKNIVDNIETYKNNILECEEILKQLNPLFAKDKERDTRLLNLENRFDGVESKLDKIFNLINK